MRTCTVGATALIPAAGQAVFRQCKRQHSEKCEKCLLMFKWFRLHSPLERLLGTPQGFTDHTFRTVAWNTLAEALFYLSYLLLLNIFIQNHLQVLWSNMKLYLEKKNHIIIAKFILLYNSIIKKLLSFSVLSLHERPKAPDAC